MNGVAEWQTNWVIISKLTREPSNRIQSPRISWTIALHLWHGVVAGIVFGLLLPFLTLLPAGSFSVPLDAVGYSVALWVIFMLAPRRRSNLQEKHEFQTAAYRSRWRPTLSTGSFWDFLFLLLRIRSGLGDR
jgi:hypothetical protein